MNTKNAKGQTAAQAYEKNVSTIFEKIETIREHFNNRENGTEILWGDIGDTTYINKKLDEVLLFIGAKKEA